MSAFELRIETIDVGNDNYPEFMVSYYQEDDLSYAVYVSSSKQDGNYDKTSYTGDADGDGDVDDEDKKIFLTIANEVKKMPEFQEFLKKRK